MKKKPNRRGKIFSGDESEELWSVICKLSTKKVAQGKKRKVVVAVADAIYALACRCQELEDKVDKLAK